MIYLKYTPHSPVVVEVGDEIYRSVSVQNDVALLVLQDDEAWRVPNLLSKRRNCESCSGSNAMLFHKASQDEIDRFNG